jgi:hypothetical protein
MSWIIIFVVVFLSCSQPESILVKQEDKWYILADKEYGPISLQKLKDWAEQGRVLPNTLIRKNNENYKFAKEFVELQEVLNKPAYLSIESLPEEEIPLIPNVTHGLQPKED